MQNERIYITFGIKSGRAYFEIPKYQAPDRNILELDQSFATEPIVDPCAISALMIIF